MEILRTPDDRFTDLPGAQGQPHRTMEGGGNFLQEECDAGLARVIDDFIAGRLA